MRIILSRKGFDSENGGYPSPILPDGTILSIPIPQKYNDRDYMPIKYEDLRIPNSIQNYFLQNNVQIKSFKDLLSYLLYQFPIKYKGNLCFLGDPLFCHPDPDLFQNLLNYKSLQEWRPSFGQDGNFQTHLKKEGVGPGDLFLFYGWFRHTVISNGKLYYNCSIPDIHIILGYLQVDYVLTKKDEIKSKPWLNNHPHSYGKLLNSERNAIYVAKKKLDLDDKYAGGGCFKFDDSLVLTETNPKINPKKNLTIWKYDFIPIEAEVSLHSEKNRFRDEKFFRSRGRGQEFVIKNSPQFVNRIKKLPFQLVKPEFQNI